MLSPYLKGLLEVATAAVLFGLIGIFVNLLSLMPLGSIIFYRLLFALFIITLYFGCCGRLHELQLKEKKQYIILLGLFQAATMLSYFFSVKHTTVSIAVLLLYTAPIYVTLLSPLLLKERVTRYSLISLILSIMGVVMVIQPQAVLPDMDGMYIIGLGVGLVSGLFYACMTLTSRYLRVYYTGTTQTTWALFITMLIFSIYWDAVSTEMLVDNLFLLVLFGLLPTAVGLILYLSGLMHVRAQNASIIALLEPVSAVIFAFIILNEPISSTTLIGGGFILLGAIMVSMERPIDQKS